MKAQITLTQGEIQEAVKEYAQRSGWSVSKVEIKINPGCMDQRDYEPSSVSAVLDVTNK